MKSTDYMTHADSCLYNASGSRASLEEVQKLCEQAKSYAALAAAQAQIEYWQAKQKREAEAENSPE